jgi:hypothetical protein
MSLINKMLSDLESREALLSDQQDVTLDGLYSAYDVEIEQTADQRKYHYVVLISALLIATVYAAGRADWLLLAGNDSAISDTDIQPAVQPVPVGAPSVSDSTDTAGTHAIDEYRVSLRFDELLNSGCSLLIRRQG